MPRTLTAKEVYLSIPGDGLPKILRISINSKFKKWKVH
jgi:hypothetical protein